MKKLITAALVAGLAASPAFAQTTNSTTPNAAGATDTVPTTTATTGTVSTMTHATPGEMASSKVVGSAVYNSNNEKIGEVNDLILDQSGKVAGVVIGVGGFLGLGERNIAVTYNSIHFDKDAKGKPHLTVPATKDQLKAMQPYDASKTNG